MSFQLPPSFLKAFIIRSLAQLQKPKVKSALPPVKLISDILEAVKILHPKKKLPLTVTDVRNLARNPKNRDYNLY